MSRRFDPTVLRDASWWHWVLTIPLLAAHLAGVPWALAAVTALCLALAAWYFAVLRSINPFPVQLRLAFVVLLLAGLLPGMAWVHWVQLVGTSAMVTLGYCLLGRMLSFAPWNLAAPLTLALVGDALFRQPTGGGLLAVRDRPNVACCSPAGCQRASAP
jgi:hypothetical protein